MSRIRIRPVTLVLAMVLVGAVSAWTTTHAGDGGTFQRNSSHLHGRPHGAGPKHQHGHKGAAEPLPIPGGSTAPDGTTLHVFAPGPTEQGFMGLDVDPSTIGNFNGFSAIAYPAGTATDAAGNTFDMFNDMRVYRGVYVAADGRVHQGTFGFV